MKFILDMSRCYKFDKKDKERYEQLGFKFKIDPFERKELYTKIYDNHPIIEFNSLEDLMKFIKKWGTCVIDSDTLEIYNDYRE